MMESFPREIAEVVITSLDDSFFKMDFHDPLGKTIFISLVFILTTKLIGVSSGPSYDLHIRDSEHIRSKPWEQPCGTPLGASVKKSLQRHSVHRSLKRVRTQFRVAQNHFRKDLKNVRDLYSKVYKVLKGQYHLTWLPINHLEWYHSELWCLEKSKKAEQALPKLHDALQIFAITFYSLRKYQLHSNINVEHTIDLRNKIINEIQHQVLRMLCEVETAMMNLGIKLPPIYNEVDVTGNPNWATEGDLTFMLVQDWSVLRLYRLFLNDWILAFRNATAIGPGTCDPNHVKPLVYKSKQKKAGKKPTRLRNKKNHHSNKNEIDANNTVHLRRKNRRKILRNRNKKIKF